MDTWKFYSITHCEHVVCNPTSEEKLVFLVGLLRLPANARVVDIACGNGDFLIRLAEAFGVRGTGIDISPCHIADAKRKLAARAPDAGITFTRMSGSDFKPDERYSMDLSPYIGASWIFGGACQYTRRTDPYGASVGPNIYQDEDDKKPDFYTSDIE